MHECFPDAGVLQCPINIGMLMRSLSIYRGFAVLVASLAVGCATSPPPKLISDSALTRVEIRADERANHVHAHPASISPEFLHTLLSGMRIQVKSEQLIGVVTGWTDPVPVFTSTDLTAIVEPLSRALAEAGPSEIVTFYRKIADTSVGLAYTSGGIFVQDDLLYVVVANFRSLPSDAIIRDVPGYLTDAIYHPLLTLGRKYYRLSHQQTQAEVHLTDWSERYEEGKTLVINLTLLKQESGRHGFRTNP